MLQKIWYALGRGLVIFFSHVMLKMDVHWKAPRPRGPLILAANHPSTTDPAFVTTLVKEQASILILETLFKVPLFGRSLRMSGHIPVVPGHGQDALQAAKRLLKAGRTIIIFPEGVISPAEGGQHRGHTGVARLALETGVPVVPVGIGLDQKHLQWLDTVVEGKHEAGAWYLQGPYAMTAGHALNFSGSSEDRELVRRVTDHIMQQISGLAQESAARLAPARVSLPARVFRFGFKFVISGV
jgi:1-acyl-sn-glycerol-3-phosphate acyltransferase